MLPISNCIHLKSHAQPSALSLLYAVHHYDSRWRVPVHHPNPLFQPEPPNLFTSHTETLGTSTVPIFTCEPACSVPSLTYFPLTHPSPSSYLRRWAPLSTSPSHLVPSSVPSVSVLSQSLAWNASGQHTHVQDKQFLDGTQTVFYTCRLLAISMKLWWSCLVALVSGGLCQTMESVCASVFVCVSLGINQRSSRMPHVWAEHVFTKSKKKKKKADNKRWLIKA